jgi:hypothetical protein
MNNREIPKDIGLDTPLRLDVAARVAFPGGGMTASGLRREAAWSASDRKDRGEGLHHGSRVFSMAITAWGPDRHSGTASQSFCKFLAGRKSGSATMAPPEIKRSVPPKADMCDAETNVR